MDINTLPLKNGLTKNDSIVLSAADQKRILEEIRPSFQSRLADHSVDSLSPHSIDTLQLNIGYMCNQRCTHCHVDASPHRKEMMDTKVLDRILELIEEEDFKTVDITGGAPEMHPEFRWFVRRLRVIKPNLEIIVRSNLTIINSKKIYEDLPQFFAQKGVHLISSLPFYTENLTNVQRGKGVFERSIQALQSLNEVGYGDATTALELDLVYNPSGAQLPELQCVMESKFKKELKSVWGVTFNKLLALANLPVARFLEFLLEENNMVDYMETLIRSFNPKTLDNLMCRSMISVDWQGNIYDCDFNQMLELPLTIHDGMNVFNYNRDRLMQRDISIGQHCYGCTAGSGSSCGGMLQ